LQGILFDYWQRPIPGPAINGKAFFGDIGLPGPDGGTGGKFLLLPPGYKGQVPAGYFFLPFSNQLRFHLPAFVL
jgi:hypothetical protein